MDKAVLQKLNACRNSRKACVVVTNLRDGNDELVAEGDAVDGALSEAITKALRAGKSTTVEVEAKIAGYDLEVIDPRTAFATPERFEGTSIYADWPEDVMAEKPLDAYCALAAVTHDPKIDDYPIAEALRQNCFYVGALGSRKTHAKRVERLLADDVTQEQIYRIKAPIGLNIGASSPQEIAVAVMAEIIEAFRKRGLN